MSQNPDSHMSLIEGCISKLIKPNHEKPRSYFSLSDLEVREILRAVQEIFRYQPILLELEAPIKVCGDIHGQYSDLLRIFECGGLPPLSSYLFLGDYVDRGQQSLETICLLFCYKIKYPDRIHLLRGNHESANVNQQYGFYEECKRRLSTRTWKLFNACFQYMPAAAVIEDRILCMHGGLSPELGFLSDIKQIERPTEIRNEGLLADLMWSDPSKVHQQYIRNEERGIAQWFGKEAVNDLLERNGLDLICRAHQCVEDGYEFLFDMRLVTLFSAPNYCGDYDNSGAIMMINEDLVCGFHIFRPLERNMRLAEYKKEILIAKEACETDKYEEKKNVWDDKEKVNEEEKMLVKEPGRVEKRRATGNWEIL